ncbi:MAG: outer membrane beta-barrel protein [Saprospiraceae bacterium]|nr:outer membrane beta-barrel protein [Saprospiraceae bacterium]
MEFLSKYKSDGNFATNVSEKEPSGLGLGGEIGYGITESIKVFVAYQSQSFTKNGSYPQNTLNTFEGGLKYNFLGTLNPLRPFISATISQNSLYISNLDFDFNKVPVIAEQYTGKGIGFSPSVGIQYFFTPEINIDLASGIKFGNFTQNSADGIKLTFDSPNDFRYVFFKLGMTYNFY